MELNEIKRANACYTGGGIYAYIAELSNGNYIMAADDWGGGVQVDSKVDFDDDSWTSEWIELHCVSDSFGIESIHTIIKWIIEHKPEGNYCDSELLNRLERR